MGGTSQQSLLFRHALIQDAAYQSLLTRKRVHFHHAIADAIAQSHPDIAATQPELVARHYTEGRRDDLALPYWKKAGERALERCANYEATDHFSNALALAERLPDGPQRDVETLAARLRLAEALTEAGRFKDATTPYLATAEQARQADDIESFVRVALGYDTSQFLLGVPLDRSTALLTEAEAKIARDDDKRRCVILSRLARAHLYLGDAEKSESYGRRGAELARRLGLTVARCSPFSPIRLLLPTARSPRRVTRRPDSRKQASWSSLSQKYQRYDDMKGRERFPSLPMSRLSSAIAPASTNCLTALTELGEVRQRLQSAVGFAPRHGEYSRSSTGTSRTPKDYAREGLRLGRLTLGDQVEGVCGLQDVFDPSRAGTAR